MQESFPKSLFAAIAKCIPLFVAKVAIILLSGLSAQFPPQGPPRLRFTIDLDFGASCPFIKVRALIMSLVSP